MQVKTMFITEFNLETSKLNELKDSLLAFASDFESFMLLDSNADSTDKCATYNWIFAIGAHKYIEVDSKKNSFDSLNKFYNENKTDIFGFLGYDLKNEIENLYSANTDKIEFPEMYFFVPEISIWVQGNTVKIKSIKNFSLNSLKAFEETDKFSLSALIQHKITKETYTEKVASLIRNIQLGNIYEANFCMEFYAENVETNPLFLYKKLSKNTNAPFGVFFKLKDKFLLSASPERYLKKTWTTLISQPMKGTAKRSKNAQEDFKLKTDLENNLKERAENIMICDLVRNDLSKIAERGTVEVEELCQVYSYPTVHQMISTIACQVSPEIPIAEMLKSCFPPGSMTGAPKIRAMQLIEEHESTRRGLYSGSVGYITENGDFDFNVVIRSLQYNQTNQYLSYMTGSAITSLSNIDDEYNECLLKAQAFFNLIKEKQ